MKTTLKKPGCEKETRETGWQQQEDVASVHWTTAENQGLSWVPRKYMFNSQPPVPVNVTFYGNRVFVDIIYLEMRLC